MADTGFKIGPNLRNKLRQTIDIVDGLTVGDGRNKVEVIHEGDMGGGGGSKVKVVAFDTPWYYGQAKTVITKAATSDSPEKTIDAVNKFANVSNGPGYIIKGPTGIWYLMSVDLMQQPGAAIIAWLRSGGITWLTKLSPGLAESLAALAVFSNNATARALRKNGSATKRTPALVAPELNVIASKSATALI